MENSISFKSSARFHTLTSKVQENTLLNRGILDVGGIAVPQVAMSNNKNEAIERAGLEVLYIFISFLTPFLLLPKFNKYFLKKAGIVEDFKGLEKKILEVSKKHLTKDADKMVKGIRQTASQLDAIDQTNKHKEAFEKILNRFPDKELLRQKLLKTHQNIYTSDFLSTAWMLGVAPWICMEYTEHKTHKKGFSAAFEIKDTQFDEKKYKADKHKKMLLNAIGATIPALLIPKLVTKGIGSNISPLLNSGNLFKKGSGKLLNIIKNNAECFDYTKSIFMSKTVYMLIWLLSDYPNSLVCSRDKHELKDRAIRYGTMNLMFFGGDYILNNVMGKVCNKFADTNIMKRNGKQIKNLREIEQLGGSNRTKNIVAGIYWASMAANMALLGFGLPAFLNRMLRNDIEKEKSLNAPKNILDKKSFKELGF